MRPSTSINKRPYLADGCPWRIPFLETPPCPLAAPERQVTGSRSPAGAPLAVLQSCPSLSRGSHVVQSPHSPRPGALVMAWGWALSEHWWTGLVTTEPSVTYLTLPCSVASSGQGSTGQDRGGGEQPARQGKARHKLENRQRGTGTRDPNLVGCWLQPRPRRWVGRSRCAETGTDKSLHRSMRRSATMRCAGRRCVPRRVRSG